MKQIKLSQGKFAQVDDQDFDWLNQWKWSAHRKCNKTSSYAIRNALINGRKGTIKMHRLILGLIDPNMQVDHIDRNGLNNQRGNLRVCTHAQNVANVAKYCGQTSKYKGVSWYKLSAKWRAQIKHNRKVIYLGLFENEIDAAKIYNTKAIELHGEFAFVNKFEAKKLIGG